MNFEVKSLEADVGAEIIGLDLDRPIDEVTRNNLYRVWEAKKDHQGAGLCCLLQKPAAFAKNMEEGFMVAGFVQDLCTLPWGPSVSDALQLDKPGWSARERVLRFCAN